MFLRSLLIVATLYQKTFCLLRRIHCASTAQKTESLCKRLILCLWRRIHRAHDVFLVYQKTFCLSRDSYVLCLYVRYMNQPISQLDLGRFRCRINRHIMWGLYVLCKKLVLGVFCLMYHGCTSWFCDLIRGVFAVESTYILVRPICIMKKTLLCIRRILVICIMDEIPAVFETWFGARLQ